MKKETNEEADKCGGGTRVRPGRRLKIKSRPRKKNEWIKKPNSYRVPKKYDVKNSDEEKWMKKPEKRMKKPCKKIVDEKKPRLRNKRQKTLILINLI